MEYASVWIRFAALVVDGLLIAPFYVPLMIGVALLDIEGGGDISKNTESLAFALMAVGWLGMFVFGIWNTIVRMGKTGQSLGRKFLNIAVLDNRGRPIGVGSAFLREVIGRFISGLVCYIGYLNAFWDRRNQMWHDKIASCYVYYVTDEFTKTGPGATNKPPHPITPAPFPPAPISEDPRPNSGDDSAR
jgi:uncharacterized RDD family membrane protein YckC